MKKSIKPIVSLILLYIGYMLLFADRTVMNISMAYIGKEFQISPAALGATASAFFLGYTLMQIPGGIVTDILGSKNGYNISDTMVFTNSFYRFSYIINDISCNQIFIWFG